MNRHLLLGVVVAALMLQGCGWHLRGQLPLSDSINVVMIDAEPSNFRDLLADALVNADATVVNDPQAAKAVVRITDEEYRREVRTLEFELQVPADAEAGTVTIPAYACYDVCEETQGVCIRLRRDIAITVTVDPDAVRIGR